MYCPIENKHVSVAMLVYQRIPTKRPIKASWISWIISWISWISWTCHQTYLINLFMFIPGEMIQFDQYFHFQMGRFKPPTSLSQTLPYKCWMFLSKFLPFTVKTCSPRKDWHFVDFRKKMVTWSSGKFQRKVGSKGGFKEIYERDTPLSLGIQSPCQRMSKGCTLTLQTKGI